MKEWFVYILECRDGTFYTGITNDAKRRVEAHNAGKGAKYTAGRKPVKLRYMEKINGRSAATTREVEIKKLTREMKIKLMENNGMVES